MATSTVIGKAATAMILARLASRLSLPKAVDIGPGIGTYRRLMREILPDARWTAVEIWGPYVRDFKLAEVYDDAYISDARCFDFSILEPAGGVAIFGDVLEHLPRQAAIDVVGRALRNLDFVVLSVPAGHWPQGESAGNPWEAHVAEWSLDELRRGFEPHFAGLIDYPFNEHQSLTNVYLARTAEQRQCLARIVESCDALIKENPILADCGMGWCPNFQDEALVDKFKAVVRPYLSAAVTVA